MTDAQVVDFVNGCEYTLALPPRHLKLPDYPAYELFTERLRAGAFDDEKGRQLRLVVGEDRRVERVERV